MSWLIGRELEALAAFGEAEPTYAALAFGFACRAAINAHLETLRCAAVSPLGTRCEDHAGHLAARPLHKGNGYREMWQTIEVKG